MYHRSELNIYSLGEAPGEENDYVRKGHFSMAKLQPDLGTNPNQGGFESHFGLIFFNTLIPQFGGEDAEFRIDNRIRLLLNHL
jgi:hypothetical protein